MKGELTPAKGMSYMYNNGKLVPKLGRSDIVLYIDGKKPITIFGWQLNHQDAITMLEQLIKSVQVGMPSHLCHGSGVGRPRCEKGHP